MKTKNGNILTFSEKMQISAILCFTTCDWFCPMTSQLFRPKFVLFPKNSLLQNNLAKKCEIVQKFN